MKKVSFDFDGTLSKHFFGGKNKYQEGVQGLLVELFNNPDFDVYIITRRYGPENCEKGLKNEHDDVINMIISLNIDFPKEKIIFTNRQYKYSVINELGIDIHLDDDNREHELIEKFTIGSSVDVKKPDWRKKLEELL